MKKILAGILAAVSMLSVSATAFASEKTVTKPGEVEYDVPVTAPTVVLNLVMPAKLSAALNPYGADIEMKAKSSPEKDDGVTSNAGIVSTAYTITNNSTEYGVYFDATAITTIETADKTKWTVATAKLTDGTKGAQLVLTGAADASALKTAIEAIDGKAAVANAPYDKTDGQGKLVMDSTVEANKENGVVAGQTSVKKLFYVPAATKATDTVTPAEIVIGFGGALAASDSKTNKEVEWTEDDAINVALVLKVTAGPKTAPTV